MQKGRLSRALFMEVYVFCCKLSILDWKMVIGIIRVHRSARIWLFPLSIHIPYTPNQPIFSIVQIFVHIKHWSDLTLHWRHNGHDGVSNHQPHGCLLNSLFRRRLKKTSKLRVTGLCVGNSPGPVNSPHKGPVTRKMFPFDDVIIKIERYVHYDSF